LRQTLCWKNDVTPLSRTIQAQKTFVVA